MASSSDSCGLCNIRHIIKPSIVWCTECVAGLCKECQKHHSLSKGTRNHKTICTTEYEKLHNDVHRITQYCSSHNEKLQMYCKKHERPCCSKCIVENHKECRDIINFDDVIQNVKTSKAFYEIEETLVEVAENLQKIRQHKQDNISSLKEKRKEIQKEIQKTRTTINNHLDKLQKDLLEKLYADEEKENTNIRQLMSSLEKKEKEIVECQRNFANIKQNATDFQIFLSIKRIEEEVSSKDKFLKSVFEGENAKPHSLAYKTNPAIQNIISDIKCFGEIHIAAEPCKIVLSRKQFNQAQIWIPTVKSRSIENIKLQIYKTVNTFGKHQCGCCMLPNGRMAFIYNLECRVKVFDMNGLNDFEMQLPHAVFDMVYINEDNTLAFTSGESSKQCITIIDLEKKKFKKRISLDSDNYGIALREKKLLYSGSDKGIQMINPHDESISDIVSDKMPEGCYTASFGNKIYHTNSVTNAVTCYDLHGKQQWTFQNENVLKSPHGVGVDNDGNVYAVGFHSHNVVVIAPDGNRHKEVLTAGDGLKNPVPLCFSISKKQLLVANCNDEARLFDFI